MDENAELEARLKKRCEPDMKADLPERIIAASLSRTGQVSGYVWLFIVKDVFIVPRPIIACALIFALGLFIGAAGSNIAAENAGLYMSDLIFTAEQVSEGDWL